MSKAMKEWARIIRRVKCILLDVKNTKKRKKTE